MVAPWISSVVVSVLIVLVFNLVCWICNENSIFMLKFFPGRSLLISSSPRTRRPGTWFCWDLLDEGSLVSAVL